MTSTYEDRDALDRARTRFDLAQAGYKSARIAAQEAADEQTIIDTVGAMVYPVESTR